MARSHWVVFFGVTAVVPALALACGESRPPTAPIEVATASIAPVTSSAPSWSASPSAPASADVEAADGGDSAEFGMIGLVDPALVDPNDPRVSGGLGVGGGGAGTGGIGLGSIGTFGSSDGGARRPAPSIRQGATQVTGRLPPEVIQRIVRQSFGRFRLCYENGLRANPKLAGAVKVRFEIDRTGAVKDAKSDGSDLKDAAVVQCIVRGFGNLSFPQPEAGVVNVLYPILFAPGDAPAPAPAASGSGKPKK